MLKIDVILATVFFPRFRASARRYETKWPPVDKGGLLYLISLLPEGFLKWRKQSICIWFLSLCLSVCALFTWRCFYSCDCEYKFHSRMSDSNFVSHPALHHRAGFCFFFLSFHSHPELCMHTSDWWAEVESPDFF